ncbi:Uncharacterized protein FWK35_00009762 [Aphis craccivora]|uniref:Uncharacterized protein n=1 Tax=Aphis craccivora TaxID=307492 RepID=A0A6G0ZDK8_APHCR|nr:Uncharacterized protein FWK35_00009762 [Aphis craccivora]
MYVMNLKKKKTILNLFCCHDTSSDIYRYHNKRRMFDVKVQLIDFSKNHIVVLLHVNSPTYTLNNIILFLYNNNLNIYNRRFVVHLAPNSERSDECIDFTMNITSRNNAPISNYGGSFRCKSEYPWCIIEFKSKHFPTVFKKIEKKNDGKTRIFTQNQFSTKSIFLYGCNSKFINLHYRPQKFSIFMRIMKKTLENFKFLRNLLKTRKFVRFKNTTLSFPSRFELRVENLIQDSIHLSNH